MYIVKKNTFPVLSCLRLSYAGRGESAGIGEEGRCRKQAGSNSDNNYSDDNTTATIASTSKRLLLLDNRGRVSSIPVFDSRQHRLCHNFKANAHFNRKFIFSFNCKFVFNFNCNFNGTFNGHFNGNFNSRVDVIHDRRCWW